MHVRKRHLPHHPEYPQVHGQQHAERQGETQEMDASAAGQAHGLFTMYSQIAAARMVPDHRRTPRRGRGPDLGMANLASKSRRASHERERHNRQQRRGRDEPSCRTAAAPGLPQCDPRRRSRRTLSRRIRRAPRPGGLLMACVGELRPVPQLLMRGDAAHIGGKRHDRDHEEHFQPRMIQVLVTPDDGQEQEAPARATAPSVGTWFSSRCRWASVHGDERRHVPPMGPGRREDGPRSRHRTTRGSRRSPGDERCR